MLAIIGPNWVDARDEKTGNRRIDDPEDWVRVEIERALARKIPVIPVLVAGAALPSKSDLPQSLQPLLKHQGATLTTNGFRYEMAGLARDVANLTVRRPWGRIAAAAASALILGGYVVAHQFGASVWWPFSQGRPNVVAAPVADPAGKTTDEEAKRKADEAEAKRKAEEEKARKAEAARDPALSVTPGSGKAFHDRLADGTPCPMCPEMVVVPAGTFTMGSPPGERGRDPGEVQLPVTIGRPFAVGKFAVTFDEWDACVADQGCNGYRPDFERRGNRPVINVSWDDAKAYAAWLSRKTGKTYRLLSEAEREYVTRAGTKTPFWWGSSITPKQANYDDVSEPHGGFAGFLLGLGLAPVDSFEANRWGLFNVHGNVWEWTEDCWNDSNKGNPGNGLPRTSGDCTRRIFRGGSWTNCWSSARPTAAGAPSTTGTAMSVSGWPET
jgi:formylglycine-generating enzyme required for sulfatase activity